MQNPWISMPMEKSESPPYEWIISCDSSMTFQNSHNVGKTHSPCATELTPGIEIRYWHFEKNCWEVDWSIHFSDNGRRLLALDSEERTRTPSTDRNNVYKERKLPKSHGSQLIIHTHAVSAMRFPTNKRSKTNRLVEFVESKWPKHKTSQKFRFFVLKIVLQEGPQIQTTDFKVSRCTKREEWSPRACCMSWDCTEARWMLVSKTDFVLTL